MDDVSRLEKRRAVVSRPAMGRSSQNGILPALPFILPGLVFYVGLVLYPILNTIILSFFRWDGIAPTRTFVGLDNYIYIFTQDETFRVAVRNSAIWVVLSLLLPTTLGLALALAVNQRLFARSLFRTIFYLPAVLASIAVAAIWSWMYNPSLGIVNSVLRGIGAPQLILDWLGDRNIALYSVFVASVWQSAGSTMVLFLAGLQTVPTDLVEVSRVDGANRFQSFRHVVIPSLRGTFVIVISLTIISSLKVFDLIYGMTYGGPGQSTHVLATWSIFNAIQLRDFGAGMAIAVVLLVITLAIVVPYIRWATREDH